MTEVILKNFRSERSSQQNVEDGFHGSKKNKELSSEILVQKELFHKKQKTRKHRRTSSSSQSRSPPRWRKK